MSRRPCQYCARPMGRFAKLLGFWSCDDCANRMAHGGSPRRPPTTKEAPPA